MSSQEYATKNKDLDVLIVGAGFSGAYQLQQLRKAGFSAKIFEAGSRLGGTWYWNCYPGARVDSEYLVYQLSIEEVWKDWTWSERFPGRDELMAYFEHVDRKLDLSRDVCFDTRVTGATFDISTERWIVSTQDGRTAHPRFLILCTGFASKPLFPDYPGLSSFQGVIHHTARWPQQGVELAGKRIGVIGTGASGVQVVQETAPIAAHLTVFQRTPNFAVPLEQRKITDIEQMKLKEELYPIIFRRRLQTPGGFHDFDQVARRSLLQMTPEERRLTLEDLWGHRAIAVIGFADVLSDERANKLAYDFWRDTVRKRLVDPKLHEKLAPEMAPHPFGMKRLALEQQYYEAFNQLNVTLVDLNETPILEITPRGVKTKDEVEHTLDVLFLATGFDALTGSISQIDIRGTGDTAIGDKWHSQGLGTYLGLTSAGYPNMFFVYGPGAATGPGNGPSCIEFQCDWIVDCLTYMRARGYTRIEATPDAEASWGARIEAVAAAGLWHRAKSWYIGANVPGKRVAPLLFTGGLAQYIKVCRESAEGGYVGFVLSGGGIFERLSSIWSERFPGRDEIMAYFEHIDKKLDLSRDIDFGTLVTGATFDVITERWIVSTQSGRTARPRFLILCTGFAAKPLFPEYPGLSSFQGAIHHTAQWPQSGVELAGKRIGVIGTGASGVQVIQETAPIAAHLTVFQRTPNFALPMHQCKVTEVEQVQLKEELYPIIFRRRTPTLAGALWSPVGTPLLELTPEEQCLTLEDLWVHRTFWAILAFSEILSDERTNEFVYNFWRDKVRKCIADPRMREKLAPETAPLPFGEQRYFEVFNQPNVTLVDLHETPILEITPRGVKTKDGMEHTFDVLVLATGFDALSGSISKINIKGTDDTPIDEKWSSKGVATYLGLTCAGYPNMFFPYGPQAPTTLCNNPACLEFQCDWVVDCLTYMRTHKYTRIEATPEAEAEWVARIEDIASMGLWYRAKSSYFGANVPGKRVTALNFMGGLPLYMQLCRESAEGGYTGLTFTKKVASQLHTVSA